MSGNSCLPPSTYPKGVFYRYLHPNICRDESRQKQLDLVYANVDYIHKDAPKQVDRCYEQLTGGLVRPLTLPWNYPAVTDEEEILKIAMACETNEISVRPHYSLTDKRYHVRLQAGRSTAYIPGIRPLVTMPSNVGDQIFSRYSTFIRPDGAFIHDTQLELLKWAYRTPKPNQQVTSLFMNHGLVNLRYFPADIRDVVIRQLSATIKEQTNLQTFTFENVFLGKTDALRILLAASLGAGHSLQKLYVCNLMFPTYLPVEKDCEYLDIYNEFEYDSKNQPYCSVEKKRKIWIKILERPCYHDLPLDVFDKHFVLSLACLSNLEVLMVNYSWLSKGNGLYLLRLESIRNGKLKKLILVLTRGEEPQQSRQVICHEAWRRAIDMCPDLQLHLIIDQNADQFDWKGVIKKSMPLTSVHFHCIHPLNDATSEKPGFVSYTTRLLSCYFGHCLRMVNMTIWYPNCLIDVSLTNLILKCPYLQIFMYRGLLDKMTTIHTVCDFLNNEEKTRLRKIGFFVSDDPCSPKGTGEVIQAIRDKYETVLALKGISLFLGVWKF